MLLKNELKKLYIKQYGLIVLLIVFIVKLLTSADLYKASYSDMSYEQQKYYLEYMQEYGGQLTDEKETAILSLYSEAEAAKQLQSDILDKNRNGDYATPEEFTNAMREIPDMIEKYDAIKLLYSNYERVSADRENLLMLPSGSNAMTSGIEYLFIMAICYISAAMCYYERKMKPLIVTAANGRRSGGYRLISLFSLIFTGWLGLFIIELTSLFAVIGAENLGCGVQSLEAFENTPFGRLSIIAMFIVIHLTKLLGYLLISAVCVLLCTLTKNLPLSLFVPMAVTCVWVYLFGQNNAVYYSPFSLVLGSPYYTGDCYVTEGRLEILLYSCVPAELLVMLITIAVIVIAVTAAVYIGSIKRCRPGKKAVISAVAASLILLLSGCSQSTADNTAADGRYGFAYDGEGYYELSTETDDEYNIISQRIIRYDDKLNLSEDDILRNITCDGRVAYMLASDGYLYYTESFQNGGTYTDNVCRIRLSDYYKETVLAAPGAQRLSRYLDLLTIWSGDSDDYSYSGMCKYRNNLYLQTDNYKVFVLDLNTGTRRLLFSENYINGDISVIDGKVFYLNSDGNPVCYDNEKKIISERMFYAIASDGEYIYCSNKSATYRYKASDFTEEKLADKGDAYMADRGGVYFDDGTYMDAGGNLIEIPQAKDGRIFLANGKVIVRNSDGELQFSDK